MGDEMKKLDNPELVTGGNDGQNGPIDPIHNLANYDRHVVAHLPAGTCLVMQMQPQGAVMPGHQFYNGDEIWVHNRFWEGGYFLAFDKGVYGFVDAQYVK